MTGNLWIIVLAGGTHLGFTGIDTDQHGQSAPTQYCSLGQGGSRLDLAVARAERLASPGRVVIVVTEAHARRWDRTPRPCSPWCIVRQPEDRGTAAGVLLPLWSILARDRDARVLLLPSDQFVADEHVLNQAMRGALADIEELHGWPILLGMPAAAPACGHGWILPQAGEGLVRSVAGLVGEAGPDAAAGLRHDGAMRNSMVMAAQGRTLLQLYRQCLPALLRQFSRGKPHRSAAAAAELYRKLPSHDFARDVLHGAASMLRVRMIPERAWSQSGPSRRQVRNPAHLGNTSGLRPTAPVATGVGPSPGFAQPAGELASVTGD